MSRDRRITRRSMIGGMAAAGAASLIGPPAGAASNLPGGISSAWVGTLDGTSPELPTSRAFSLVGVEWSSPAAARIELRVRGLGGAWSPWVRASVRGHGPDTAPANAPRIGEPLWCGPAHAVQLRSAGPVHGVRLHFVSVPPGTRAIAASALPLALPALDAGPGQPPVIARSAWAHGARPAARPSYGSVQLAFVHHTENLNGYGEADVPAMLLAMYQFHRYVQGWHDIGYNFVVDLYGRIWEARAGGIDQAVIGAQAGGYNEVSTGVSVLGTFSSVVPSAAAIDALERLLAWKLSLHGAPTLGHITVRVAAYDYYYTPYHAGQRVTLPRVAGHRDGDATSCPGDAFYAQLPSIRPVVARLAGTPAVATIRASVAALPAGGQTVLSGELRTLGGPPLAGAPIELQRLTPTGSTTFATLTTAADGSWTSSPLVLEHSASVRALHRPAPAAVSELVEIAVAPRVELSVDSLAPLRVSGTVSPGKRHVTVEVWRSGGRHRRPLLTRRAVVANGRFSVTLPTRRVHGHVLISAHTRADASNAPGAARASVTLP